MGVFTKRHLESVAYSMPRQLVASAQQVKLRDPASVDQLRKNANVSEWQSAAWEYFDLISEVKFAFSLLGNVTSRVRMFPAMITEVTGRPTPLYEIKKLNDPGFDKLVADATACLARLRSAQGGQPSLLREFAINLSVAGECYLVQQPPTYSNPQESFDIRSVDEVVVNTSGRVSLKTRSDMRPNEYTVIPEDAFVGRIWRSHPRYSDEADSSMRGVLELCADLLLLTQAARATARSRLNAGALYIPDGLSAAAVPPAPELTGADSVPPDDERDEFEEELINAMTTPITDLDSASAVVPLIIRGPAELGDRIKQFKFERSFDPALAERADRLLERILQGLDVPKELVTGLANVKYSNAQQIDKNLYKSHVEPLVLVMCDALTTVWLRPAMLALGYSESDVRRLTVWYDASDAIADPDRSEVADKGYENHLISGESWRQAHGFTTEDAPSGEELAYRIMIDRGTIMPETFEMVLSKMAPELMGAVKQIQQAASPGALPPNVQDILSGNAPATAPATGPAPVPTAPPIPPEEVPVTATPAPTPAQPPTAE